MKRNRILFTLLIAFTGLLPLHATRDIVPIPDQITWEKGEFSITKSTTIGHGNFADGRLAAEYLQAAVRQMTGLMLKIVKGEKANIVITTGRNGDDNYELTVKKNRITINGADYNGVVCGIATLRQLIDGKAVPCVTITDSPRFGWRGFHLDCSRHFFSKDEVKEIIDLMALYKLNRFHWHLTDDQGWRIEIKKYPLLTERGAWRTYNNQDSICLRRAVTEDTDYMLLPDAKKRVENGDTLYGGYYSQDDIREIVAYARQRGIETVPEIDMPGHMLAAISNYDGLSCFKQIGWGKVFTSPLCPGKDSMLRFCRDVWDEVFQLFPYEYVHIGGDEVEKDNWKKCPDCQQRIKDHRLKDEKELQSWFIKDMEKYINKHGRKMIGWDEIIEGGLSETATLMWWRTWEPNAIPHATAQGNDVIYCPNAQFYIDYSEDKAKLPAMYDYELLPNTLNDEQKSHVLGVQANLWTEWVPSRERALYMYFPRILALSELAWSKPERKNFEDFQRRLVGQYDLLNRLNVPYRMPDLEGFCNVNAFTNTATVNVINRDPHATVRYTTDGSFPDSNSPKVTPSLTFNETTNLILRTFGYGGRPGEMFRTQFIKQGYLEPVNVTETLKNGLNAAWYDFVGETCKRIPKAPFKGNYPVSDVKIPDGVRGNIGLIITGYIRVPADDIYTFALKSDDGSWLKIDGNMIVDNDRPQSPHEETGQVALRAGYHTFEARYFDSNGGMLRLHVLDSKGNIISPEQLFYSK